MKDFKHIPMEYRPVPFWSWNEKLTVSETEEQIDRMHAAGMGGFFMHARGGLQTEYMGEEWFENIAAAAKKAAACGMHPWAYDENGWPSGFGNGAVNGLGLAYQQKFLRLGEGKTDVPADRVICKNGDYTLYYDVNPYYVDTLDAGVVKKFIEVAYAPYDERFSGKLDGFFTDEPTVSRDGIPWSFTLPDEYRRAWGEELLPRLHELFVSTGDYKTTRVRFYKLVTDLFSANYMKQIADFCRAHGFRFTGHLVCEETFTSQLTSNGACMPHYEYFDVPGMDWLGRSIYPMLTPYQLGSAARQLGKKQVLSESFAMCGHNVSFDELKHIIEYQMVRGVNLLCQHLEGYSLRGLRKRDYPPAMYIQQPWWDHYRPFCDAVSRTGMLLSEGEDGVDLLVIHPQTTMWSLYDGFHDPDTPMMFHKKYLAFLDLLRRLEEKHIGFHLGDETLFERHGRVEDGKLVVGQKKYGKVLLLPDLYLLPATEKLLSDFRAAGGRFVTEEELPAAPVTDCKELVCCERHTDEYDLWYFVNGTEQTHTAHISVGDLVLDPVTGETSPFAGTHTFHRYESLLVLSDRASRRAEERPAVPTCPLDLSGAWEIAAHSENILTLDTCDYYFDGTLTEKNGYILNAMYRAIDLGRPVRVKCVYHVTVRDVPERIHLVCETPEIFDITVNGRPVCKTDLGFFRDKSFRRLDIAGLLHAGENEIVLETDLAQSPAVYENIEKGRKFESEKNKLTFDREIEQIYLVGDFAVKTDGKFEDMERDAQRYEGAFVLTALPGQISLSHIERQGFPFFAGEITLRKTFPLSDTAYRLDARRHGVNVLRARVNGTELPPVLWEPAARDLSGVLHPGENTVELTLVGNLRNMQGPFHLPEGESISVGPHSFYKEPCIWCEKGIPDWSDGYCFVQFGIDTDK